MADVREKQTQAKLVDLNKQLDNALSERLELDAKVESASDEMRYALCINIQSIFNSNITLHFPSCQTYNPNINTPISGHY